MVSGTTPCQRQEGQRRGNAKARLGEEKEEKNFKGQFCYKNSNSTIEMIKFDIFSFRLSSYAFLRLAVLIL